MSALIQEALASRASQSAQDGETPTASVLQLDVSRDSVAEASKANPSASNVATRTFSNALQLPKGSTMTLLRADVGARGSGGGDIIEIDKDMTWTLTLGYYMRHCPVQPNLVFNDSRLKSQLDNGLVTGDALLQRQATLPMFCSTATQELVAPINIPEPLQTIDEHESVMTNPRNNQPGRGIYTFRDVGGGKDGAGGTLVVNPSSTSLFQANYCSTVPAFSGSKQDVWMSKTQLQSPLAAFVAGMNKTESVATDDAPGRSAGYPTFLPTIDSNPATVANATEGALPRAFCMAGLKMKVQEAPAMEIRRIKPIVEPDELMNAAHIASRLAYDFELTPNVADTINLELQTGPVTNPINSFYINLTDQGNFAPFRYFTVCNEDVDEKHKPNIATTLGYGVMRYPCRVQGTRNWVLHEIIPPSTTAINYVQAGFDLHPDSLGPLALQTSEIDRSRYQLGVKSNPYASVDRQPIAPPLCSATANIGAAKIAPARVFQPDVDQTVLNCNEHYVGYSKGLGGVLIVGSEVADMYSAQLPLYGDVQKTNLGYAFAPYYKKVTFVVESGLYSVSDLINRINEQINYMTTRDFSENERGHRLTVRFYTDKTQSQQVTKTVFATGDGMPDGYLTSRKSVKLAAIQEVSCNIPQRLGFLNYVFTGTDVETQEYELSVAAAIPSRLDVNSLKGLAGNAEFYLFKNLAPVPIPIGLPINPRYARGPTYSHSDQPSAVTATHFMPTIEQVKGYLDDKDTTTLLNETHFMSYSRNQCWALDVNCKGVLPTDEPNKRLGDTAPITADAYLVTQSLNLTQVKVNISSEDTVFYDFTLGGLNASLSYDQDMSRMSLTNLHSRFTASDFTLQTMSGLPYCFKGTYHTARGDPGIKGPSVPSDTFNLPDDFGVNQALQRICWDGFNQSLTFAPLYERISIAAEVATGWDFSSGAYAHEYQLEDSSGNPTSSPLALPIIADFNADEMVEGDAVTVYGNHLPDTNREEAVTGFNGAFVLKWCEDDELDIMFTLGFADVQQRNYLNERTDIPPLVEDGVVYPFYDALSVYNQYLHNHTHEDINYSLVRERSSNVSGTCVNEPTFQSVSTAPLGFDAQRSALHGGLSETQKMVNYVSSSYNTPLFIPLYAQSMVTYNQYFSYTNPFMIMPSPKDGTGLSYNPMSSVTIVGLDAQGDLVPAAEYYTNLEFTHKYASINEGWPMYKLFKYTYNDLTTAPTNTLSFPWNLSHVTRVYPTMNGTGFPMQPPLGFPLGIYSGDRDQTEDAYCWSTPIKTKAERLRLITSIYQWVFDTWWTSPSNSDNAQKSARDLNNIPFCAPFFYRNSQQQRRLVITKSKGLRASTLPRLMRSSIYVLQCEGINNLFPTYSYLLQNGTIIPYIGVVSKLGSAQDMYQLADSLQNFTFNTDTEISSITIKVLNPDGSTPQVLDGDLTFGLRFQIMPSSHPGGVAPPRFGPSSFSTELWYETPSSRSIRSMVDAELEFYRIRQEVLQVAEQARVALDNATANSITTNIIAQQQAGVSVVQTDFSSGIPQTELEAEAAATQAFSSAKKAKRSEETS